MLLLSITIHLLFAALSFTLLNPNLVYSHPQCLDFKAPFHTGAGLSFCSQNYSDYGCCTLQPQAAQAHYVWVQASGVIWSNLVGVY